MKKYIVLICSVVAIIAVIGVVLYSKKTKNSPQELLQEFFWNVEEAKYEEMYELISKSSKEKISKEDFVSRNKKIYEGIEISKIKIEVKEKNKENIKFIETIENPYENITFENEAKFVKEDKTYKLEWSSNIIFPNLEQTDKVKVFTTHAKRGKIFDRNEIELATNGDVASIGIVPGKLENRDESIQKIAEILNISSESIENKLKASWVKDDSFVPIKNVAENERELKEELLQIKGIMISTVEGRIYPLGEEAAHLTGYIQSITKEELEKHPEYSSTSLIGKSGLEKKYEEKLKGKDGIEIYISDENGNKKQTIINKEKIDGEDVKLTIDSKLQTKLYNEMKNNEGTFVVMNYETGEVLALVSTPSYDVNKMALGISQDEWKELQENEKSPMLAKYLQKYCPGSTFKPITAGIGLSTNSLKTTDTFEYSGLSWQKDSSWGNYNITTLTEYSGEKNLKNALIYSDNIYFAQATLQIGKDNFIEGLKRLKFGEDIDFELNLAKSQYSNSSTISEETLLADSGYGQGQILVNPVHMASIYSSFANEGNMVKPYLEYKEDTKPEYIAENVFTEDATDEIKKDLIKVVEQGTAKDMRMYNTTIAGKTGTAELKASKDTTGGTLGWFNCFTTDYETPYLIVGMVENAKENGGSHFIIPIIKKAVFNK